MPKAMLLIASILTYCYLMASLEFDASDSHSKQRNVELKKFGFQSKLAKRTARTRNRSFNECYSRASHALPKGWRKLCIVFIVGINNGLPH